jgi:hypothetical protein
MNQQSILTFPRRYHDNIRPRIPEMPYNRRILDNIELRRRRRLPRQLRPQLPLQKRHSLELYLHRPHGNHALRLAPQHIHLLPSRVRLPQLQRAVAPEESYHSSIKAVVLHTVRVLATWRVLLMLPLFFCANIFYSYQQNDVNGMTFNIRTRSLNGALYWIAQMFGGLLMGLLLDLPFLDCRQRARLGCLALFIIGMTI